MDFLNCVVRHAPNYHCNPLDLKSHRYIVPKNYGNYKCFSKLFLFFNKKYDIFGNSALRRSLLTSAVFIAAGRSPIFTANIIAGLGPAARRSLCAAVYDALGYILGHLNVAVRLHNVLSASLCL